LIKQAVLYISHKGAKATKKEYFLCVLSGFVGNKFLIGATNKQKV